MPQVSPEMIWAATRDTSCYIIKHKQTGTSGMGKRGAEFSLDPLNVASKNSWKYSSANPKIANVTMIEGGVELVTKTKNAKRSGKPDKMLNKTALTKDFRRVAKSIKTQTAGKYYRGDLTDKALARWTALHRYTKVVAGVVKKAKTKTGRKGKN